MVPKTTVEVEEETVARKVAPARGRARGERRRPGRLRELRHPRARARGRRFLAYDARSCSRASARPPLRSRGSGRASARRSCSCRSCRSAATSTRRQLEPARRSRTTWAPRIRWRKASSTFPRRSRVPPAARIETSAGAKFPSRRTPASAMNAWPRFQLVGRMPPSTRKSSLAGSSSVKRAIAFTPWPSRERQYGLGAGIVGRVGRHPEHVEALERSHLGPADEVRDRDVSALVLREAERRRSKGSRFHGLRSVVERHGPVDGRASRQARDGGRRVPGTEPAARLGRTRAGHEASGRRQSEREPGRERRGRRHAQRNPVDAARRCRQRRRGRRGNPGRDEHR